jgi:hypothetical protein
MIGFKKQKILTASCHHGCDVDGDVFIYKGKFYFVDSLNNIVERLDELKIDLPFWKRRKITGRVPIDNKKESTSFDDFLDAIYK